MTGPDLINQIREYTKFVALAIGGFLTLVAFPTGTFSQDQQEQIKGTRARFPGRIYLASFRGQDKEHRGIVALDPNEGTWQEITAEEPDRRAARVSPDGSRLALDRLDPEDVDPGLWLYKTSGEKEAFRISEKRGYPCWSPDGNSILVTVIAQGGETEVWRVAADGSHEDQLPLPAGDLVADWSSDGLWLLTMRRTNPDLPLYLMHPDGTGEHRLLASSRPLPDSGGQLLLDTLRVSPHGQDMIALVTVRNAKPLRSYLLVMDINGGRTRRLFDRERGDHSVASPHWSPDGKAIAVRVIEEWPENPGMPYRSSIQIVGLDEKVLKTAPWPEPLSNRYIIDWR